MVRRESIAGRWAGASLLLAMLLPMPAGAISLPKGEGLEVVRQECTRCHSMRTIANTSGKTRDEWVEHVVQMTDIENRPANMQAVVDYLSEHFPPWAGGN